MGDDKPYSIIRRAEWGALQPKSKVENMYPPTRFISAMWSRSEPCHTHEECLKAVRAIQIDHMNHGLPDIAYNFLIGDDGRVYEGRGWLKHPSPNKTYPELDGVSFKIALIGQDNTTTDKKKTEIIDELLEWGKTQGFVAESIGFFPEYEGCVPERA